MYTIYILGIIILVALDQWTKWLAVTQLQPIQDIPIVQNIFHLTYVENKGAAFGIMQGKYLFFVIITFIVITGISIYYYRLPKEKKYHWMRVSLILLVGGAIGNLIDRIRLNYVIDFLYFKLIDFPVFNVADICVVVGVTILSFFVLFVQDDHTTKGSL